MKHLIEQHDMEMILDLRGKVVWDCRLDEMRQTEVVMQNALLAKINTLSVAERILLVEDIWDHLTDTDESAFMLSDEQRAELDQRIVHYQDQPEAGRYWNEVREEYFRGKR